MILLAIGFSCIICGSIIGLVGSLYYLDMPLSYHISQSKLNDLNANFDKNLLENEKLLNRLNESYQKMNLTLYDIANQNNVSVNALESIAKQERILRSDVNGLKTQDYISAALFDEDAKKTFEEIDDMKRNIELQYEKIDAPTQNLISATKIVNDLFGLKKEISSAENESKKMTRDIKNLNEDIVDINEKWEYEMQCGIYCENANDSDNALNVNALVFIFGMLIIVCGSTAIYLGKDS